jgi:arsenate reductase-like glutaredoxin family protein
MAPKRATFLISGTDEKCNETQKFIQEAGVLLTIRDISEKPLSYNELNSMIGFVDIRHFINEVSESYDKHKLGSELPDREAIIKLMAEDNSLIKLPIIITSRLMTIGCDKKRITEMLQLNSSGKDVEILRSRNSRNHLRAPRQESPSTTR